MTIKLSRWVSAKTGTIVEKSATNYTAGKYCITKKVILPENNPLKQKGIDSFELTKFNKNKDHNYYEVNGKRNGKKIKLVEGSSQKALNEIRTLIKMIKNNNIKVS